MWAWGDGTALVITRDGGASLGGSTCKAQTHITNTKYHISGSYTHIKSPPRQTLSELFNLGIGNCNHSIPQYFPMNINAHLPTNPMINPEYSCLF